MDFQVTLEDLYNGQTRTLKVARKVLCKACKGSGAKGGQTTTCPHCGGKGQVMSLQSLGPGFNIQMQTPCTHCQGKGKIAKHVCPICQGSRLQMEEKSLELVIERGMRDGQEINFPRASEQAPDTVPGDVIVTLRTQPHSRFKRQGNDLHMEQTITLREALLGYSSSFAHMDGHRVQITQEGVTPPEYVKILKGEGMPQHEFASEKGDLYIKFHINFPRGLNAKQQEAIKALFPEGQ
jgi:DnaJ-class molecular chaperone